MYKIGQKITTTYTDAPVSEAFMYKTGQEVDIKESGRFLASFIVTWTDNTTIEGIVNKVAQ